MDLRRLRAGEWMCGLAGAALIASLFLPWYSFEVSNHPQIGFPDDTDTAWEAFAVLDGLLFVAGCFGIAVLVVTAVQRTVAVPIALSALTAIVASLTLLVLLVRLPSEPDPPRFGRFEVPVDVTRVGGIWLGVGAAVVLAAGAWIAIRDERLSRSGETTDATGRPIPPPPEIERIPAPRP